jgi:broad specificity phosphatase PhoE
MAVMHLLLIILIVIGSCDSFTLGADGKNAAPAKICDVEKVPLLDEIPEGHKRLFMVRHGEVINPGGDRPVYYGAMDVSLSPLGELEAIEAASYLSRFRLQHVASSPLSRALFGAHRVLESQENNSNDVVIFEGFKELNRGAWCGKTKEEIGADMLARFDACDESVTPGDGGESYPTLKSRVIASRDKLLEMTDVGRASAIVSHLQVTRAMLSDALDLDVKEMAGLKIGTASITCVDYCSVTANQVVRYQSFKPECGLVQSKDGAN